MPRVVIVGGGISGLSTAYYLSKAGIPATIVESRPRLGGVIQTEHIDGCLVEAGPDSWLAAKPAAMDLVRELGLEPDSIGSNDHLRKTFIRKGGRMVPMPDGLMMMVPTKILPMAGTALFGWGTKLRMAAEVFRRPKPVPEESVAAFVREHYGQEAVDYLAEPLLSGIYGGDPEEMSARAVLPRFVDMAEKYGSLSRGLLAAPAGAPKGPIFRTLRGGLGQLVDALTRFPEEVISGRVERVEQGRVRMDGAWLNADHIVLACEAHNAAALASGRISELLSSVGYTSATVAALIYDASAFPRAPEGFGFLVPKKERRKLMACTWVGTKFSDRAPQDKVVARCFSAEDASADELSAELAGIAGIRAKPRETRVFRWPQSMAQYRVGHGARMAELDSRLAETPWLQVAGNAYQGIGIPDCVRMGKAAADRISRT